MENNIEQIKNSLMEINKVFAGFEDYRVIGSTLVAAINNGAHRELHDIDLLIDEKIYEEVSKRLQEQGFKKVTKRALGFGWDEYQKDKCLTFGVLLRGKFTKDYFEYKPNNFMSLVIKSEYLKPTSYKLYGETLRGIPIRSVYEGIKIASLNKKRESDKYVVLNKIGNIIPSGLSLDQAFYINLFGVRVPHLYTRFSEIYNLIGGVRLAFGRSYDPWH